MYWYAYNVWDSRSYRSNPHSHLWLGSVNKSLAVLLFLFKPFHFKIQTAYSLCTLRRGCYHWHSQSWARSSAAFMQIWCIFRPNDYNISFSILKPVGSTFQIRPRIYGGLYDIHHDALDQCHWLWFNLINILQHCKFCWVLCLHFQCVLYVFHSQVMLWC